MHYRQRIRDAVRDRLLAANTLAGPNVFTSRAKPVLEILQKRESVLSVYTSDEASTRTADAQLVERTLTISIEGMAGGGDDLDDTLDEMASAVEAAIFADPDLGGLLSSDMELTATTSEISARGNMQVGAFRMDFDCGYLTSLGVDAGLGPEPPVPTAVTINHRPNPDAYTPTVGGITPTTLEQDVVAPSRAPEPVQSACADGSCAIPAWTGDQP
jgi:hypothetical protein